MKVICDSFRDRLTILVIGVSSTSTHDFNRLLGIGSNGHDLVGDARISFLTSSEVAGSKHVKSHFISGGGINSGLRLSVRNFIRIISILSTEKVEKLAQREGRSVESGIDGIFSPFMYLFADVLSLAINLLHRCSCLDYFDLSLKLTALAFRNINSICPPRILWLLRNSFSFKRSMTTK